MYRERITSRLFLLTAFTLLACLFSLKAGLVHTSWNDLSVLFRHTPQNLGQDVIWQLRLPRVLSAFICGGLLALAGCIMQLILANPLAEPYILGTSGAASVAALLAILFGAQQHLVQATAFVGASVSILLVERIAATHKRWSSNRLLLTGVIFATIWGAGTSFIIAISPQYNLQHLFFWLLGDLQNSQPSITAISLLVLATIYCSYKATELDVLSLGELKASSLGLQTARLYRQLYFISAACTALAVSMAGNIGFIGLLIPHCGRLWLSHQHRILIPATVLLGGGFLCIADTIARTMIAPLELPVGIITALLGAPWFLYLLSKQ